MASLFRTRQPFLQTNAWQNQALNALHYNTSQVGSVIPLIYGTTRQAVNLIGFGNYRGPSGSKGKTGSIPVTGTNSRVGKGGNSKSGKKATPDYTVDAMFGICQGPITGIGNVYSSAGIASFSSLPLNFYSGTDGQAADTTFAGLGQVVGYSGTTVLSATPLDLGPSPVLPNIGVEVIGLLTGVNSGSLFPNDANPANVITDFLTNSRYGAGFPSANLDDLTTFTGTSFAEYCQAGNLVISVSLDGHQKAIEWLDGIAKLVNTAMFFGGKLLKFVPYGDLALNSNGSTWTPNLIPEYNLTDHHFLPWRQHELGREPQPGEDDPILVTRTNTADADNWMSIEYTDRDNFYNTTIIPAFDQGLGDTYGLRMGDSVQGRAFCNPTSAEISLRLALQRKAYIRNTPYKLEIGWQFARLLPMDIITLTGRYADLYLEEQPVRILSIEEDDQGGLTVEAEEIQTGVAIAPVIQCPCPGPNSTPVGGTWDTSLLTPVNKIYTNSGKTATWTTSFSGFPAYVFRGERGHSSGRYHFEIQTGSGISGYVEIGLVNALYNATSAGNQLGSDVNSLGYGFPFIGAVGLYIGGALISGTTSGPGVISNDSWQAIDIDLDNNLIWITSVAGLINAGGAADPTCQIGGYDISAMIGAGPFFIAVSQAVNVASGTMPFTIITNDNKADGHSILPRCYVWW